MSSFQFSLLVAQLSAPVMIFLKANLSENVFNLLNIALPVLIPSVVTVLYRLNDYNIIKKKINNGIFYAKSIIFKIKKEEEFQSEIKFTTRTVDLFVSEILIFLKKCNHRQSAFIRGGLIPISYEPVLVEQEIYFKLLNVSYNQETLTKIDGYTQKTIEDVFVFVIGSYDLNLPDFQNN